MGAGKFLKGVNKDMVAAITRSAVNMLNKKRLLSEEPEVAVPDVGTGVMARRGASPKPAPVEDTQNPALVLRDMVRNSFKKHREQQPTESE